MKIRPITNPEDFIEIFSWLDKKTWPLPKVSNVAPNWGFLAEDKQEILACVWIYFTGTSLAEIEWVETNPEIDKALSEKALKAILEEIKLMSSSMSPKIKVLRFFSKDKHISNLFHRSGFKKEKNFSRLLWASKA